MRKWLLAAVLVFLAGCGGSPHRESADHTVRDWARALSLGDFDRACGLSDVPSSDNCAETLRAARTAGDPPIIAERSFSSRKPANLYDVTGPTEIRQVSVRRRDGKWRVHFEVQIVR